MAFGFVEKAFKGATKAVSDTVKGAAKVTSKVFSSKVFNIATTAMCFIPGFNVYAMFGRSLPIFGKAANSIRNGLELFKAIQDGKKITDTVKNLQSGKFQPLGPLSKFVVGNAPLFQPNPMSLAQELQGKAEFAKQLQSVISGQKGLIDGQLPVGLPEVLGSAEAMNSSFVKGIANVNRRIQSASEMLQELQRPLNPNPLLGSNYVVRC
jgi:hypothetical protein